MAWSNVSPTLWSRPRVEYRLTADGLGLDQALLALDQWARARDQPG